MEDWKSILEQGHQAASELSGAALSRAQSAIEAISEAAAETKAVAGPPPVEEPEAEPEPTEPEPEPEPEQEPEPETEPAPEPEPPIDSPTG